MPLRRRGVPARRAHRRCGTFGRVSDRVGLVVCPEVRIYDHGPQHPLRPDRVLLTWDLIRAYGLDAASNVHVLRAEPAADDVIGLVHTPQFIDATRRAGQGEEGDFSRFGYGPGDNPIFPRMHEAGALVVGASVAAARAVWEEGFDHAFSAAGGLHHAMPARASGFCVYDDPAVAIAWLLGRGAGRVAYVDVDVHHGDGPQAIFYAEPRVLTVSIHESGEYLFPGTGFPEERGAGAAEGTKVNVPLPPGTGDAAWLAAFREVVPARVREFRPDVLVTQLGCDTHATDPLAHLRLTTGAYREAAKILHALAHEAAGGRWVATGGGGYQWARVVPRAWTIYFAEMAGALDGLPDELPEGWIEEAEFRLRGPVPTTLSEEPAP
ncbi:MAG: acetoin utilization protein AcuC [Actinobacteria bacterium]|nr:acetoin utilization protein AcuC [Actinomycetota bacterium]